MTEPLVLDENTYAVWRELAAGPPLELSALASKAGIDPSLAAAIAITGTQDGVLEVSERPREELAAAEGAADLLQAGLPERRVLPALAENGFLPLPGLVAWAEQAQVPLNEILKWGAARGWLQRSQTPEGPQVRITEQGRQALGQPDEDERALEIALQKGRVFLDELPAAGIDPDRVRKLLAARAPLARLKKRTERIVTLAARGREAWQAGVLVKRERNALTPEDLASGAWRGITLRPYDVTLPARTVYPAKVHPVRKIIEETRRCFLEMGFTEVASPMVESAFWNFDALYQPQDHPARDMQDTFYMEQPAQVALPDAAIVEPVRQAHENGGNTGSEGWGYRWSPEEARRVVLRTHTTAASIRALAAHPQAPRKTFCVGWTFRNETISYKHLPVFHQVDGIIIDESASLATLLGALQEFYRKMGFAKVKFKPAFYPYTEPSADVVVYMESRGKWIEMGGSGIFRPEVTLPLGCKHRVLAWGLGIERLAMLRYGFSDIRELYRGDLDAIEGVPLCR